MEQSPSWEAKKFSASQENPHTSMKPKGSLLHSQVPATCPHSQPAQSSQYLNIPLPEDPS